jgi:bifunctional non-homologous end joining protein LigD
MAKRAAAKKPARKAPLRDYRRKRDFTRTPEPKPKSQRAAPTALEFVVQKHAARRLHYDLRLELDGVLKSWAVTRGPSLVAGEKRLAVHTEDHPIEYLDFEGNIPKGEYGGGTMIVWDRGTWQAEGDAHFGLKKGHLAFTLEGRRLRGRWHLVRMRPKPGEKTEPWLLIKSEDEFARHSGEPEITEEQVTSFLTGRTTEQLAAEGDLRSDHAARGRLARARKIILPDIGKIAGARKGLLPTFLAPSLASVCDVPPSGAKWVHEIKYDGYRIQARIDAQKTQLLTRKNLDWTDRFASIKAAVKALNLGSALLDGEIVAEDASGMSSLSDLQADLKTGRQDRLRYHVFDLLYCEGFDLTRATLLERKALLEQILAALPPTSPIRFSEHLAQDGPTMFEHAARLGLEGIISKRKDLPYRAGRGDHWCKSKCVAQQEFIIVGYIPSTAASGIVGSLALAYYEKGKLNYAGRVGTGWSMELAKSLRNTLEKIATSKPKFANTLPEGAEKGVRWSEPQLVCEVQYRAWSHDGLLLQASFGGLREDKSAEEVVLEKPLKRSQPRSRAQARARSQPAAREEIAGVTLTHPDRLLWDDGITKEALAEFYVDIADWILPHVTGRVLSLLRAPSGTKEKSFFAKHPWAGLGDSVRHIDVGEEQPMMAIDDLGGLISLVQSGVVEIHPWGSRADNLERPDGLIFDLDPGESVSWREVIEAAKDVRTRLEARGLTSFVKTSGGKGLHVVVPIEPRVDWETAREFTRSIAEDMSRQHPDRYVATMSKRLRGGHIFVDYLRNGRGATAVAAYSTRARPHAPISTPLAWEELSEGIRADHFRFDNLQQRLRYLKRDPWDGFFKLRQRLK